METAENLFKRQLSSPQDSHNLVLKYCQDVIVPKYENVLNDLTTKVHDDFCDFCEKNRIPMDFARVYIIVNR